MAGNPSDLPRKKASPKVFDCANCGAGIPLRAIGHTVTVACPSCGSVIDATNENYRVISTVEKKKTLKPLIPLGTRGKLHGLTWEVIGFMQRTDAQGHYPWKEYLLFNPYHGFRWLTEADGHWNFVRMTKEKPSLDHANAATFHGETYRLFHRGHGKVAYVLGEFYWRVKVGETVAVEDYISPPRILSLEKNEQEAAWSLGEYLDSDAVKAAFGIKGSMPIQAGVAPNQRSTLREIRPQINLLAGIFIGVVVAIQFYSLFTARNQEIFRYSYAYSASESERIIVTPPFEVTGRLSNLQVHLESPVDNNWLFLEAGLVNDRTGKRIGFTQGVEYYHGYDSDGSWREGSRSSSKVLAPIPAGTYRLVVQVADSTLPAGHPFTLSVRRGVPRWPNFFWAVALLGLGPLWLWWRDRSFEMARWSTSDYSPYPSSDDDDED